MSLTVLRAAAAALVAASAAACAELVVSVPAGSLVRVVAGLLLALVLPGTAVSQLLLPNPGAPLERVLLAIGSSVAVLILDSALLYVVGIRLGLSSWAWSLAAVTAACAAASLIDRRSSTVVSAPPAASGPPARRGMHIALGGASAVVVAALLTGTVLITAQSVARRSRADHFTQLWALPVPLSTGRVTVGLYNHQGRDLDYRVWVRQRGRVLRTMIVPVRSGGHWTGTVSGLPATGPLRVNLTSNEPDPVYRWVRLRLRRIARAQQ